MTKEILENDPYKLAGVDIEAGENLIKRIKNDVASTPVSYTHLTLPTSPKV